MVFCMFATQYGLGAPDSRIPEGQLEYYHARVKKNMIIFELIYFGASISTKFSMVLMILRLSTRRRYAYTIWGSMFLMALVGTGCLGVMFGNCKPFVSTWNEKL
ncbi:hypothetical protein SLS62_011275 [Diatrype stigma]|uniref:Rhodopsin domain-containing protein n=1 Tax=Diatrype stigma TaxID=117547 RepID=A0AAN9UBS9_9PEZI